MRTPHWLTPLAICFLVLTISGTADAQFPGVPGPTGINTNGLPPGAFQPYPSISPFEMGTSRTYNSRGTWFNESTNFLGAPNKWFLKVDFLRTRVRGLDGLVGSRNATSYYDFVFDALSNADNQTALDFASFNLFNPVSAHVIPDIQQGGVKFTSGFDNPDGSGIVFDFTWNRDRDDEFNARRQIEQTRIDPEERRRLTRGNLLPDDQLFFQEFRNERDVLETLLNSGDAINGFINVDIAPLDPNEILDANLFNLNSIPLDNGSFGGVAVPYDIDFILKHSHETIGGTFGYMMSPIVRRGPLTVRPIIGGRYLRIKEGFRFFGVDSNLLYNDAAGNADLRIPSLPNGIDDDGDFIVDNHVNDEEGNGGNLTVITGGIVESRLTNEVTSNMAGPEFALRYDVGDISNRGFTLFGQTKVGVMINQERSDLFGDNIGAIHRFDPLTVGVDGGFVPTEVFQPTAADPNPNAFEDGETVTRAVPLFEQSFQAEIAIFDRIPVLSQVRQLRGAKLRAGFTWLWIGGIASPNQSIVFQGNPQAGIFPELDILRDDYSTSTVNFGLSWDF